MEIINLPTRPTTLSGDTQLVINAKSKANFEEITTALATVNQAITDGLIQVARKYVEYTVKLTQVGATPPTPIVLEDTLGGVELARSAAGVFTLTKTGAFPENKTVPAVADLVDAYDSLIRVVRISDDVVSISTWATGAWTLNTDGTVTGDTSDGLLTNQYVSIKIYN